MHYTLATRIQELWRHDGFQKYLANTGWAFFGKVVSLGISFITSIYVIRHLGPSNYGMLAFSVSFVTLFSFIASLGLDNVLYRELAKDITRKNELLGTALMLRVIASLAAMLLIFAGTYLFAVDGLTKLLIFINSLSLLFSSSTVIGYYFQAKVQAKYQAIPLIIVTSVLSLLKVAVIYFDKGVIYFASVLALEYVLYGLFNLFHYARSGNKVSAFTVKGSVALSLVKDSWPLMLSTAFIIVYTRIDQVMLKVLTDNFNVGVYDAAVRISEVWYFIPALIISSVFPAIVNAKKTSEALFKDRIMKLYSFLFYMAFLAAIPIATFSTTIITIIYGEAFLASSSVLSLYIWAGIPVFLTMVLNTYLLAENKTIVSFTTSFLGMIANVALNMLLIPRYGVEGAALATLISYSIVPLSVVFFSGARDQLHLMKKGIFYPIDWASKNI